MNLLDQFLGLGEVSEGDILVFRNGFWVNSAATFSYSGGTGGSGGTSGTSGTSGFLPVIGNNTELVYRDNSATYDYNTSTGVTWDGYSLNANYLISRGATLTQLEYSSSGVSVSATQIPSDWTQVNTLAVDYIKNKPPNLVVNDGAATKVSTIVVLTSAAYSALGVKDSSTLYVIVG